MFARILKFKLVLAMLIGLAGCGNDKTIDGVTYGTYGVLNQDTMRNPNIEYELSPGSIIVAIIFIESIVIPVYVVAFDLYQPVGKYSDNHVKGQVE